MAGIFGSLTADKEEQRRVLFMLATGFFMGVFIATYQITADSLFLNRMGQYLNTAFLVAGILGIISTGVFSWLQNRVRFSVLTTIVTSLIFLFTILVYGMLTYASEAWQRNVIFAMYCASGPIVALLLLSYWGTFGRLFNFRQSKNIIGWIDTGQLVAAILASFTIPLTAALVPETVNYLFVCQGSVLIMGTLLVLISLKFPLIKNDPREFDEEVRHQTSIRRMFSDRYILQMSSLVLVSMLVFIFTQYSFQETVKEQYQEQRSLTNFMAFFTGAVYGLSLLMQTFVNNRIIGNYGLRTSLYLMPVLVMVFSLGAVISGFLLGFHKETNPAGFVYFLLFIAMARLANWTIRDSLETPVLKLFFIPLDSRFRFNLQAKVEGLVNESSRFIAGLLVFGLTAIPFFEVIHVSLILVLIGFVYLLIINKLYQGYRNKIRLKLEQPGVQQERLERGFDRIVRELENRLAVAGSESAVFAYKFLEKLNFSQVSNWVNALMRNPDESVRVYAQDKLNELKGLSVSDKYVIRINPEKAGHDAKTLLSKTEMRQIIEMGGEITKSRIQQLTRSANAHDRQYAAELLLHTSAEECISFLCELLHDVEPHVRNAAIKSAIKKHNNDVILALIDNLGNPLSGSHALNALILIGTKALPMLDAAFYRSGQSTQLMLRIIQAIGRIGGQRAQNMLWNKLDYPNKVVVSQVLLSLGECGFKANTSQVTRIKYVIENDIADIRWNLSAIQELGNSKDVQPIIQAIREEIQNDLDHLYMLLAMLYDTHSIQLVKENIESGTTEGITYAIELLDVFLSDQLKQRIIPVLDEIPDEERIRRLDIFYPRAKLDQRLVMKFIINRDFTQSNRWTKACVLYYIGKQKLEDFKIDLLAQLFNPDPLIHEVAAWALWQINPEEYEKNLPRLGLVRKKMLDEVVKTDKISAYSRVRFLSSLPLFEKVPGITLSYIADISKEVALASGQTMVADEQVQPDFFIVVKGKLECYRNGRLIKQLHRGDFLGEMPGTPGFAQSNLIRASDHSILLQINKDRFYELMTDHIKLADSMLQYVK
ncbi:MAG: cyclic nucleotide-binding domain-containing protein [Cyclobacteriaceae bacterium]|nr:cyclic nucleotide-binding domain-containing protein [Cyclobacteriaceae bacterium]MCX7637951.1 cyclic nucleotide-binding domain-containing protein [Cyclobacteriaceae bacterium]MDW8332272.1 cyclic nucleotide-binding domain-containing protein [Cyclobacteriaceae bacterium]